MSAPVLPAETRSRRLADYAFGTRQFRSAAELPVAAGSVEMWWQAVALGGTGHYAAARHTLHRLRADTTDSVLLSLAASTEGSLRRQLGWHARAAHDDGRAAALVLPRLTGISPAASRRSQVIEPDTGAGQHPAGRPGAAGSAEHWLPADAVVAGYQRVPDLVDAAADALIGLAADALGTGRLALATRLLDRCAALLEGERPTGSSDDGISRERTGPAADRSRALVRLHWVRAETALAGGRGEAAMGAAEVALALSESGPSTRHRVKSRLLVAAAAGVTGDTGRAAELAAVVEEQCRESGLLPLRWACAMLRTGLPGAEEAGAAAVAEACRARITGRGGLFRGSGR